MKTKFTLSSFLIETTKRDLNNSFRFDKINPKCNYNYIIFGHCVRYYIVNKKQDYHYNHTLRKEYIEVNGKDKQLVMMNPGNQVNLKLTLNLKELKPIANFANELYAIFTSI
ncbi:restriction endonuclease [Campylobacter upsaliensis]